MKLNYVKVNNTSLRYLGDDMGLQSRVIGSGVVFSVLRLYISLALAYSFLSKTKERQPRTNKIMLKRFLASIFTIIGVQETQTNVPKKSMIL